MLDAAKTIAHDDGVAVGHIPLETHVGDADCDTPNSNSAPAERDGGQKSGETHRASAAVSTISVQAKPESSGGHKPAEAHMAPAAAATNTKIRNYADGSGQFCADAQADRAAPVKPKKSGKNAGRSGGQAKSETQRNAAAAANHHEIPGTPGGDGGQAPGETQQARAAVASIPCTDTGAGTVGGGHGEDETLSPDAAPDARFTDPIIAQITQAHRMRRRWLKARNGLILQGKAVCRSWHGGDKKAGAAAFDRLMDGLVETDEDHMLMAGVLPFIEAIRLFEERIKPIERQMVKLAKKLPVADFILGTYGISLASLASIVGEAGDLSEYRTVSGVWKRMGLAVIDGERQRKVADAEKALVHGYSPARRSTVWNIGNGLIGGMGLGRRPLVGEDIEARDWTEYEKMFVRRLRIEAEKDPDQRRPDTKDGKESYSKHAAARAKRYVEKRFLLNLTIEWRRVTGKPIGVAYGPQEGM